MSLLLLGVPAAASAATVFDCRRMEDRAIQVDGLLDEWGGRMVTVADRDPRDASMWIRCAYDGTSLYIAVNVTDERLIRSRNRAAGEDHLVLAFGARRLEIFPGQADYGAKPFVGWTDRRAATGIAMVDSLQKNGWSIELSIALKQLPAWSKHVASLPFTVELHDADQATESKIQSVVTTGPGALSFDDAARLYKSFLTDKRLRPSDISLDVMADMDGAAPPERVVLVSNVIGVFGDDGYTFIELPVPGKDILESRVIDLAGEGKSSIIVRYVERGNGGSREVLAVFVSRGGAFARIFAHELSKVLGASHIKNSWSVVPRRGKKGMEIVIKAGEVVGFDEASWNERPAEDMVPIVLPWDKTKAKGEVWRFQQDTVSGG